MEGMNLAITSFTFKSLPVWVFDTLGGRESAKELRDARLKQQSRAKKAHIAAIAAAARAQRGSITAAAATGDRYCINVIVTYGESHVYSFE